MLGVRDFPEVNFSASRSAGRAPLLNYTLARCLTTWMYVHTTTLLAATTDCWVLSASDSALSKSYSGPSTRTSSRTMRKHTGNTRIRWTTSCSLSNVTSSRSPLRGPIRNADELSTSTPHGRFSHFHHQTPVTMPIIQMRRTTNPSS